MADGVSPRVLCNRPLFGPIAAWLQRFEQLPTISELNALSCEAGIKSGSGAPLRFVASGSSSTPYEQQVFERGEVPTRADNWHDFYNALCWLAWPKTKAALNARHVKHLQPGTRGAVRDAATQFDECGLIVLHANPTLPQALIDHQWHEVFWCERRAVQTQMRCLVVGHALYERLHAPYMGLCGKAVYLEVTQALIDAPIDDQTAAADAQLAAHLASDAFCASPRMLHPLPLLGIPGVTPDNEREEYYLDQRQFRPRPSPHPR